MKRINRSTKGVRVKRRTAALSSWLVLGAILPCLSACGGGASTASSLRVEVEVYKGPLSLELDTQLAELFAIVEEARDSLELYEVGLRKIFYPAKKCDYKTGEYVRKKPEEKKLDIDDLHCKYLHSIKLDIETLEAILKNNFNVPSDEKWVKTKNGPRDQKWTKTKDASGDDTWTNTKTEAFKGISKGCGSVPAVVLRNVSESDLCNTAGLRQALADVAEVAARMKVKALYQAHVLSAGAPQSYMVRGAAVSFANLAGQYSNQLSSRADAILKQLHGSSRQQLPTSVYLRDTRITDFPNLYAWHHAAAPPLIEDAIMDPLATISKEETVDRIRGMERLFADHYWTSINTVYASGQGEVRMAFIKDDIGNWDLKSFDNDPSELLEAYKNVTLAGLEAAAKVAADTSSGGSTKALDLASRFARGQFSDQGATVGSFNIEALHERAKTRLNKLKAGIKTRRESLAEQERQLTRRIEETQRAVDANDKRISELEGKDPISEQENEELFDRKRENDVKRQELGELKNQQELIQEQSERLPGIVLGEARDIIEEHEVVVDVLQESVVAEQQ